MKNTCVTLRNKKEEFGNYLSLKLFDPDIIGLHLGIQYPLNKTKKMMNTME